MPLKHDRRVRLDKMPRAAALHAARLIVDGAEPGPVITKWSQAMARERIRRKHVRIQELSDVGLLEAESARAADEIRAKVEELLAAEKKNPFKYLHVKPDAEKAWERFDKALRLAAETGENVPNCQGRSAEFVDYDDDDLPTAEDAYRMCYGCPLIELCANYAEQERPAWGVHGGVVWINGEALRD